MKKSLFFSILLIGVMVFLDSCKETKQESSWTGSKSDVEGFTLEHIVWSVPGKKGWEEHKAWERKNKADVDEMDAIWKHLSAAEKKVLGLNPRHQLSLEFRNELTGDEKNLRVLFDPHKLKQDNFVGIGLFSPELGKLLRKYLPEETKPDVPWDRKRVEKMQQLLMEQVKKRQQESGP